ncbi:MAG: uracil-DNA glycosylase [Nitrospirae bacterium]|nr:uracil-DNA glycosylase [Nitrospirota bacterium]
MGRAVNEAADVKAILEFCRSLGFERLPVTIAPKRPAGRGFTDSGGRAASSPMPPNPRIPEPSSKAAALKTLREEIGECARCKLSDGRKYMVFGEGNPRAELMFIGEGPGREEDLQARPFVGEAGKLLTKLIEKMGFRREDVYIGNIVKCRPPQNRDPEEDEIRMCLPFIERQIEIIAPKVIVALGRISAQTLTGTKIPISKLRGRFYEFRGTPLMPTFHPAYLLRNPKDKWLVWEDARKVIERLKEGTG